MNQRTRRIIILTLIPIMIALSISYYFYNKGPVDVTESKGIRVNATTLYQDYLKDTAAAAIKYGGKILEVTGALQEVRKTNETEYILLLQTGTDGAYINCSMEGKDFNQNVTGEITVKAICDGILTDADLGIPGDVILKRAVLVK